MSFSARLADGDEGAAERALANYVAYHKLTGGIIPREATIKKLGEALGMRYVSAKRIMEDAQRMADRAAGTAIEKAARNGDVGTAFSLMEQENEREEALGHILANRETADTSAPCAEAVKDITRKAAQTSISAIRGIRSWFRKIEKATRPTDEQ